MASTINASNSGSGGIVQTADASGVLQLQSAGTTAVTITTAQNVGIGTTSPATPLEIAGGNLTMGNNYQLNWRTTSNALAQILKLDNSNNVLFGDSQTSGSAMVLASGNLGIGNTSPGYKLSLQDSNNFSIHLLKTGSNDGWIRNIGTLDIAAASGGGSGQTITFSTGANYAGLTERMRIDGTGRVYAGSSTPWTVGSGGANAFALYGGGDFPITAASQSTITAIFNRCTTTGTIIELKYNAGVNGSISTNGTNVAYNTSSDYRLKENIAPMTGALTKVAQLKPVTYKWKINGSDGEGFIAHELAEVCPQAVHGTKDEVDADGNPVYQGIDTSFLVATLTAAIQELKAELDALKAKVGA